MKPTDSELEILQVLWLQGPSTVRFVHNNLHKEQPRTYTTTLKTMQVVFDKGLLKRDASQRSHIYTANVSKEHIQTDIISKLKSTVFDGSTSQLVISAIGQDKPSKKELEVIRALIDKLDKEHD